MFVFEKNCRSEKQCRSIKEYEFEGPEKKLCVGKYLRSEKLSKRGFKTLGYSSLDYITPTYQIVAACYAHTLQKVLVLVVVVLDSEFSVHLWSKAKF